MKKIFNISTVIILTIALAGCVYFPVNHEPTEAEQAAQNIFANDTTATIGTINCVILEMINEEWKEAYIDTTENFLSLVVDTLGNTIADLLDITAFTPGEFDKYRINLNADFLSGYAKFTVDTAGEYDFYYDLHSSMTIWNEDIEIVPYDVYGMSTACAMAFKADTRSSLIREHWTYSLEAGDYYIRFKKSENIASKFRNHYFGIIGL